MAEPERAGRRGAGGLGFRRLGLIVHVLLSAGLLGAVVSFFVLILLGMNDPAAAGAFVAAERISTIVILPAALAGWVMGMVQALTTPWGLTKHYWVLVKTFLTSLAIIVLLVKQPMIHAVATSSAGVGKKTVAVQLLLHAAGGFGVLFTALVLSILKPEGRTGLKI